MVTIGTIVRYVISLQLSSYLKWNVHTKILLSLYNIQEPSLLKILTFKCSVRNSLVRVSTFILSYLAGDLNTRIAGSTGNNHQVHLFAQHIFSEDLQLTLEAPAVTALRYYLDDEVRLRKNAKRYQIRTFLHIEWRIVVHNIVRYAANFDHIEIWSKCWLKLACMNGLTCKMSMM